MGMIREEVEYDFSGFALIDVTRLAHCADQSTIGYRVI